MSDLLNDSQRRSVKIALKAFERNLRQAAAWLDGIEEKGLLYQRKLTLPVGQRRAARQSITAALEQVAALVWILGLEPESDDAAAIIRGKLVVSWANLVDTQSDKLKRYGDVDPRLESVLDPAIQRLAKLALEIESIFEG